MTRFVIDPEVAIRIVEGTIAPAQSHELLAPTLMRSQVLDTLYGRVRRGDLEAEAGRELNERFARLKVRYLGDAVLRRVAWTIADRAGMPSTLKAEYIALTKLQADALVTEDAEMSAAAKGIVEVARPSALGKASRRRKNA